MDDATGASCALNQPSDVWFLAGTYGGSATRTCVVPQGRKIYAPVINQICTVAAGQLPAQALRACTGSVDATTASLDGAPLRPREHTSGTVFAFRARAGSPTGFTAGSHDAVVWGYWLGPVALRAGSHTLTFTGRSGTFTTGVTYRLQVTAGDVDR